MSSRRQEASIWPYRPEITELDDSLTVSEVAEMLAGLRFTKPAHHLVEIDQGIRDYLLRALRGRG